MKPGSQSNSAPAIRLAIVTMDGHLAGACATAEGNLRKLWPGLSVELHSADQWAGNKTALAECHEAIARADIVIATMLFLEDHTKLVAPALAARRAHCDAMFCALSAAEVVKQTRFGGLDMANEPGGVMGMLKKLKPKREAKNPAGAGEKQMKMLRNLPKILKFIPGTAQDLRVYFLGLQYWLAGSAENMERLVQLMVGRYAAGPRAGLRTGKAPPPPVEYAETGLYHPRAEGRIVTDRAAIPHCRHAKGTIGLLLLRSYILAGDSAHYDGVIGAIEAAGYNAVPIFAVGLDQRAAIARYFMADGKASVDAVCSLTGFSLVGGPAYNDSAAAEVTLAALDVPYVVAAPLEFQTIEDWEGDVRGLTPIEATLMVALPELDGGTMPMIFGGRRRGGTALEQKRMCAHPERAAKLAARLGNLVALRKTARAARKLGIILFNFPPNAGATGTAAYLSVFASLFNTLTALRDAGYAVEVPADVEALRAAILKGNAEQHGTPANVGAKIPRDLHIRREPHLAEIEKVWGPAPGRQLSDGASIFVMGARFGNVFVGVQPAFGYEGDPMRLLFEGGFAPTHAFSAFYQWLKYDFGADAVLHFGTHGALEFMPGKQAGLSGKCWPDRLINDLPNFYLYAANNPSEGMLAKRRGMATLISHLTPPVGAAGLYKGLVELKASLERARSMGPDTPAAEQLALIELVQAQASALELAPAAPAWSGRGVETAMAKLAADLLELEYTLIPEGLHVVGAPPGPAARARVLDAAGILEPVERARVDALMSEDHELPGIIQALDGGYIRPAPGGDLLRTPAILPTGRNLYGFDPFRMPTAYAVKDGAKQAELLLARHAADVGGIPETVALLLWGSDNLKSEGGPLAQALWLLGAAPRRDGYGRLCGAELVPLSVLGRPRVDVIVTLSGIFRDLLPLQTKLLAEAALLAAQADEPVAQNFVRKHVLDFMGQHGGSIEDAALRVFSNQEGNYGANVNNLIESGAWENEDELGRAYMARKGFAYGVDGQPARHDALLGAVLGTVEAAYQNLESLELGVTSVDHYFDGLGGLTRAVSTMKGGDKPALYISDQTRGDGKVRTLNEQVALEMRTRTLNPKYIEDLLIHGHEGVRQIEAQVTNTLGWSATTGAVDPWVYRRITETFVLDKTMRDRLAALNPTASARLTNRLIEAQERSYWAPDEATLAALRDAGEALEDRLEGIELAA